jgi:predicted SnoaL-like aldol condensation-catalyzing enzyme
VTGSSAKFAFFEKFFSQKGGSVNQSAPKTAAVSKAAEIGGVNCPAGTSQVNLETFKAFLDELLVKKQPRQAFERLAMKDLIQYDSAFGENRETTIAQWESMTKQPDSKFEIESATLEGDIGVVSFSGILKPGTPGAHVINYFRFRCGKIVEIWDRFEIKNK